MKKFTCLLLITTVLISCGTKNKGLKFSAFEVTDETGVAGIKVEEDGKFFVAGMFTGTVDKNGFIRDTANQVIVEIRNDSVFMAVGKYLYRINENGTIDDGSGILLKWNKEGELLYGDIKNGIRITPADQNSFQAASILWRYYTNYLI